MVEVNGAVVETGDDPWLCGMKVCRLDAVAFGEELPLDVEQHSRKGRRV